MSVNCLRLIPYYSQPAKIIKSLAFTASDAKAYLMAVDKLPIFILTGKTSKQAYTFLQSYKLNYMIPKFRHSGIKHVSKKENRENL